MQTIKALTTKLWDIIFPIGMYYVTIVIVMFLMQTFVGSGSETYMLRQLVASLVAIPVIYTHYRWDRMLEHRPTLKEVLAQSDRNSAIKTVLMEILVAALISIALNNLISMSPLVELSNGYQEATTNLYGGPMIFEILASGLVVPIVEELLYRGVVYQRLKRDFPKVLSILLSALIFGIIHYNLVQSLYAFLLGIVFALFLEQSGHMYGAVIGHMTANLIAILRTETGFLNAANDGSLFAWVVSIALLICGATVLALYRHSSL